ncbi:MAG: DNA topoisomerase VI subunit B [Planctomycetes bacterium]|nr:DNA topoisomerase VI subunit B [Planctomycetota bacterium]
MAKNQRSISISEFFTKNRHLLGFDNPRKALLTTIKEAVDNSLDACEEAGILPDIKIEVTPLQQENRFRVTIQDNGPGILKAQIPSIFAKLLYGSKFHRLKMSRGQQGIGISAAGMYGQLTTGKPIRITSRTSGKKRAHYYELMIDTQKNEPTIVKEDDISNGLKRGTRVEIDLLARYLKGKQSVDEYLEQTAIANPHVRMTYQAPGEKEPILYRRAAQELPREPKEIKPHPHGVELGMLIRMLRTTKSRTLASFLKTDFSRVSARVASQICEAAKLYVKARPSRIARQEADNLFNAINATKIMNPPTDCISPIGEELILKGLRKQIHADFFTSTTRSPSVYRGNPFQVEVGLAYGGDLPAEGPVRLLRYANRVPLLYQQSACAVWRSVIDTDWRNYGLQQSTDALPTGPMVLFVHFASVWVPFTSESKEAIAHYPEITKEIRLALQECGRNVASHIKRRRREADAARKKSYIQEYIPHIAIGLKEILSLTDRQESRVVNSLTEVLEKTRKM